MIAHEHAKIKIVIFQSVSERQYAKWTKIVKFRPSRSTIFICLAHFNSITTETIFTIFSHDVEQLKMLLMRLSARRCWISFQKMRAKSEDSQFWRLQKSPKINWLPWQRPFRNGKNWSGLTTFTQIPSIWWKNRENWSSRSCDRYAQFTERKKRKVKYIARSTT